MSVGLRLYPEAMESLTIQHLQETMHERDLTLTIKRLEDDLRATVAAATVADEPSRKLYTNDAQRDAALRAELRVNTDYIALQSRLDEATRTRVATAAYMERLRREQRLLIIDYEHQHRLDAINAELKMRVQAADYEARKREGDKNLARS